jgi:hypothetical protein
MSAIRSKLEGPSTFYGSSHTHFADSILRRGVVATYQFSALSDGQAISFSPTADVLNFDPAIAAADIRVTVSGSNVVVTYLSTGKDVTLFNVSPLQLATSNVTFANGSRLLGRARRDCRA